MVKYQYLLPLEARVVETSMSKVVPLRLDKAVTSESQLVQAPFRRAALCPLLRARAPLSEAACLFLAGSVTSPVGR